MDLQNEPGDGTRKGILGWGIHAGPISRSTMPEAKSAISRVWKIDHRARHGGAADASKALAAFRDDFA